MQAVIVVLVGFACAIYWGLSLWWIHSVVTRRLERAHPNFRAYRKLGEILGWSSDAINWREIRIYFKYRALLAVYGSLAFLPLFIVFLAMEFWYPPR